MLAQAAWAAGQGVAGGPDVDGRPYEEPGEFTNPADPAVRHYNLDLALDAVNRGVDDILWDYGAGNHRAASPSRCWCPGMNGSPEDAIVAFLAESHTELRRRGAYQGVATAGIAVTDRRPASPRTSAAWLATPTTWCRPSTPPTGRAASSGVANPPRPSPTTSSSGVLERYQQLMEGTGTAVVPSLQDFSPPTAPTTATPRSAPSATPPAPEGAHRLHPVGPVGQLPRRRPRPGTGLTPA